MDVKFIKLTFTSERSEQVNIIRYINTARIVEFMPSSGKCTHMTIDGYGMCVVRESPEEILRLIAETQD